MHTYFELWHLASGNLAGDFDREEEALAILASVLADGGPEAVAEYGLGECNDADNEEPVYSGDLLVKRVMQFTCGELPPLPGRTA
jgi:hypothetical protein